VVIPSYNHGRYVEACVESALAAGDGVDLEVVVVDDGSTDDSLERLATFEDDPRVQLHPQENQGAHAAFNRGLDLARGEILFLLNSDDLFEPGRIPRFLDRFDADPEVDLLTSWIRIVDGDGDELGVKEAWRNLPPWPRPHPGPGLADLGDPLLALLESNHVATTSNVAVRRRLVAEHGLRFQPLRYTHDWEFLLAAGRHGGMAVIEEPLVRYRVHPENTLAEGRDQRGQGRMRFEILWTVARHTAAVLRRAVTRGRDLRDLRRRLHRSLPRFGQEDLLYQLLLLRGDGDNPPASYGDLLDPSHPFTRRAVEVLGQRT
jgi:glycosyltransferase involved in cell wall biosynthesis